MHKPQRVSRVYDRSDVPNGTYDGSWSGYVVTFVDEQGRNWQFDMSIGVRGLNCPCTVHVKDGEIGVSGP